MTLQREQIDLHVIHTTKIQLKNYIVTDWRLETVCQERRKEKDPPPPKDSAMVLEREHPWTATKGGGCWVNGGKRGGVKDIELHQDTQRNTYRRTSRWHLMKQRE